MRKNLVVVGMGYVGLPAAVVLAENGWNVIGVDVNPDIVALINAGRCPFSEAELSGHLAMVINEGWLHVTSETPEAEVYIIAVPTPFKEDHEADVSYIERAIDAIVPKLKGGELLILESTSPVGTTRMIFDRIIEQRPDLAGDGTPENAAVCVAHAPERVLPGQIMKEMTGNSRIVGGLTPRAAERAAEVYASFCEGEICKTDAATAELTKLAENTFRDVNIAFANELSLICDKHGINVRELISLANQHPRVDILNPGPGVGGHCIAVDPWFIVGGDSSHSHLIRTAREVNDAKPMWVIDKFGEIIANCAQCENIVLMGLTFKANVNDLRESPSLNIAYTLAERYPDKTFVVLEPNIRKLPDDLAQLGNVFLSGNVRVLEGADAVLVLVGHRQFRYAEKYVRVGVPVLDTIGLWDAVTQGESK